MFVMKMPPRKRKKRSLEAVVLLLVFGLSLCAAQVISEDDSSPSVDSQSTAFFALRSCHQVLGGDSGQFFSPDYLCSNPPLWCNWTIQVHPGKRVHLQLSDLTPDDSCYWRRDQIHIDELRGQSQPHSILQKCWGEATYTSTSNTVHVVLLIEGSPTPPYRGFHVQYQAFGPPEVYTPPDPDPSVSVPGAAEGVPGPTASVPGPAASVPGPAASVPPVTVPPVTVPPESVPPADGTEIINGDAQDSSNLQTVESEADGIFPEVPETEATTEESQSPDPGPDLRPGPRVNTAIRRNAEEPVTEAEQVQTTGRSHQERDIRVDVRKWPEPGHDGPVWKDDGNGLPEEAESRRRRTNPQLDHRADARAFDKYHNQSPHLPGDLLFEVSVEVNVSRGWEPWNDVAQTLLVSVKALIRNQLKPTLMSQSISSKRIKRLNAGALFILWLQMGQRTSGNHAHEVVHSSLLKLIGSRLGIRRDQEDSLIMSLSTADVNECDSQLVACDPRADCVNHFGSYSCRCREGFEDQSRSGTGTVCVDLKNSGCSSPPSSEAKAVFVLFFLLSVLVLSLLVLIALFYHRHRRGHFVPSPSDPNNNNNNIIGTCHHDDLDLPPPPPPRCPPVDLQLLRYNSILAHETKA